MKVKELIEKLAKLDPDLAVTTRENGECWELEKAVLVENYPYNDLMCKEVHKPHVSIG